MRCLLDSHVLVWWLMGHGELGAAAGAAVERASEVYVSAVTPWELTIKRSIGRLSFDDGIFDALEAQGLRTLDVTMAHGVAAGSLPFHHRDPFDRMLVAQARLERLTLVTADRSLNAYDVDLLDATT